MIMEILEGKNGQLQFDIPETGAPLTDDDIRWEKLRYWVEQQMHERRWAGDVYRYTAYEATFKKMEEIENE